MRCRWCYIGGKIPGEDGKSTTGGLAILSHPSNFRSPQPVRIHPDMPYFTFSPQELGEFKIEPGTPYVSRYRIVTTDGAADKELLDRLWNDFATPAETTVRKNAGSVFPHCSLSRVYLAMNFPHFASLFFQSLLP